MGKGIPSHNRLIRLHRHIHQTRNHAASRINFVCIDIGFNVNRIVAFDNHSHFFQRSITCAFSNTIHRHFHLTGTIQYPCNGIGSCQAQIVVAMSRDDRSINIVHMLHQVFDFLTIFSRKTISCRIRNIHYGSTGINYRFYHASQIFIVCPTSIFCIKFHIIRISTCIANGCHCPFNDFFSAGIEFITNVCIRCPDTRMNTFTLGKTQSLGSHINITFNGTCQCADGWPSHSFRNFNY